MLQIKNLTVKKQGKTLLKSINLQIPDKTVAIIFGPNGSGKSTLFNTIAGLSGYDITSGEIFINDTLINNLPIHDRVNLGICTMFQRPPTIRGVTLDTIVSEITSEDDIIAKYNKIDENAKKFEVQKFLYRDINDGLSGGEIKRSELYQMSLNEKASIYLIDEPDSGVDVENIFKIAKQINNIINNKSAIIITHQGKLLQHLNADIGYILINGRIKCSGNPYEIFKNIEDFGYSKCIKCTMKQHEKK